MDAVILDLTPAFFLAGATCRHLPTVLATVMRPASLQGAVMTWNREELRRAHRPRHVFATIEFEGGFAHDEGGCPAGQQLVVLRARQLDGPDLEV
jgi:hypothetical protein